MMILSIGCGSPAESPESKSAGAESSATSQPTPPSGDGMPANAIAPPSSPPTQTSDGPGSGSGFDVPPDLGNAAPDDGDDSAVKPEFQLPPSVK